MSLPGGIVANADDLGASLSVNEAIGKCYEAGLINSASLLTNSGAFEDAVDRIASTAAMVNIGIHVNLADGFPLTQVDRSFLHDDGSWNLGFTGRKLARYDKAAKTLLYREIDAQVKKALDAGVILAHLDSHHHLHTIPGLFPVFLAVAKSYGLKVRLAQTYRENSTLKYLVRQHINRRIGRAGLAYSSRFETVSWFLHRQHAHVGPGERVEIMLHPDIGDDGVLTDHYDAASMREWIAYVSK